MPVRFYAHFRDEDRHGARPVRDADSPEDAAIGFLECHHPDDAQESVGIVVIDHDTGGHYCFQVDVGSHETAPCD